MEIYLMDETFQTIYTLDIFESLIWTERYNGYGDFEFYTPVNDEVLNIVNVVQNKMRARKDCYVWMKESDTVMVIEDLEIKTDTEAGNHLTISGRGLESLLERRIIWTETSLNGNLQNGVKKLVDEAIINPSISDRKIPKFVFLSSTDEYIKSLTLKAQYTGDNLYETILSICNDFELGFDVILDQNDNFVFSLTYRNDYSFDQEENPYVIFSPNYENLINSDYLESGKTLKNVTLVAGEDSGTNRKRKVVGSATGLARRELYTDARDIQSESYMDQINEDTETLNGYKSTLSDIQKALSELNTTMKKEESDYAKNQETHNKFQTDYNRRVDIFRIRIDFYESEIEKYKKTLDQTQLSNFKKRNEYKEQSEALEKEIKACEDKINKYEDKIKNEQALTYEKLEEYESGIDDQKQKKEKKEKQKSTIDQKKTEIENDLPNFKDNVPDYEEKISKYTEIMESDQDTLEKDIIGSLSDTYTHNKKMSEYTKTESKYESDITYYQNLIDDLEYQIEIEKREIDDYYESLLYRRGSEKLSENVYTTVFTGEINATKTFIYGEDFLKGDIVQIVNEYGMISKAMVIEFVRVQDTDGYATYPTFQLME